MKNPEASDNTSDYSLIDCGENCRLDQAGKFSLIRPALQAQWDISDNNLWEKAGAKFIQEKKHSGVWEKKSEIPDEWVINIDGIYCELRLTPSGQIGIFPEQLKNWRWIKDTISSASRPLKILNCFAYTGLATMFASSCHSPEREVMVCHLDGAKSAVNWARKNAGLNNMADNPIKWMVEDVLTFMNREIKRGNRYDGIILDPPAFGRGPKGENWKLERDMKKLIASTNKLLSDTPLFVLLSCHAPEFGSSDLENHLKQLNFKVPFESESGTLVIPAQSGTDLPNGIFSRIYAK